VRYKVLQKKRDIWYELGENGGRGHLVKQSHLKHDNIKQFLCEEGHRLHSGKGRKSVL